MVSKEISQLLTILIFFLVLVLVLSIFISVSIYAEGDESLPGTSPLIPSLIRK